MSVESTDWSAVIRQSDLDAPPPTLPDLRAAMAALDEEQLRYPFGRPHVCHVHPDIERGKVVRCGDCGAYLKLVDGQVYHSWG